ncbi:MAG: Flp pilus assembly protein CpaB [Deltaproteobacteria bacterium]|nr:Flp pilus assembly protein CpaB [Deltaproteobacteria bacterium]
MAVRPRAVIVVGIVAVIVAGIASTLLYKYLKRQEQKVREAVATKKIVVASRVIPVGTAISASAVVGDVKLSDWPERNMPVGVLTSLDSAAGRVALMTLQEGDPVTESKLVPREGAGVLTYRIPDGHRAMTVGVDKVSGVSGFISPGNMVDVVVTTKPEGYREDVSKIFLQNIPVLATGHVIEKKSSGEPEDVPTVTLDVTPEQAEKLALASTQGRLQMILRRAGDINEVSTSGATVTKVIASSGAAARKPVAGAGKGKSRGENVEVLRSINKSVETFRGKEEGL